MTVSTVVDHNDYTGNGVTTSFPYTFRIFQKTDLTVSVLDLNGNLTVLVLDTDYTVTNAGGYTGGSVVLTAPLANGWQISIARELEATQETDLRNQGKFFAEVHEDAFDKLTMLIQQVSSLFRLALRKPSSIANWYDALNNYIRNLHDPRDPQDAATKNYVDSSVSANFNKTLRVPEPINSLPSVAIRRNTMPAFDNDGNAIVVVPPSGSASDVLIQLASSADGKGDELITVKQPFTGSVPRTQHAKNMDTVSARDFGGIADGGTHPLSEKFSTLLMAQVVYPFVTSLSQSIDWAAAQAAVNSLAPAGGRLYLPKGAWVWTDELSITNMPVQIVGDGMYATRIEQVTAGANGIHFVSNTSGNAPSTDNLLINCLHLRDLSVNRGQNSGGTAVLASWSIMTSNSPQAIFENVRIYAKTDAARAWAGGLDLRNCNGLRISTVQIIGNVLESASTTADPYTLRYGIRLSNDSGDSLGLISFFKDKLTVLAAGVGIDVFGWHEGFEIGNSELVQVATGIRVNGNSTHKNPDFFYQNSHIEARVNCVVMSNVFKPQFIGCDLFHASAIGYTGAIINLNGCDSPLFDGTKLTVQRGSSTYTVAGIVSDGSYHGVVGNCHFIGLDSGIDVLKDSWMIGNNDFYQVTYPIRLYGNNHTLGPNKYTSCANGVTYVGTGHQITPITYIASYTFNVTTAGSQQGFTVPIPAGIFNGKPDIVQVTPIGGSSTLLFSCAYNYGSASTTATGVKIELTGSASIPVGSYVFGITASSRQ